MVFWEWVLSALNFASFSPGRDLYFSVLFSCSHLCVCLLQHKTFERENDGSQKMLMNWRKRQICLKDFWLDRVFCSHLLPVSIICSILQHTTKQSMYLANTVPYNRNAPLHLILFYLPQIYSFSWGRVGYLKLIFHLIVICPRKRESLSSSALHPHNFWICGLWFLSL